MRGTSSCASPSLPYGVVNGANAFVLRAVDSAGNVFSPSNTFTLNLNLCQ